MATKVAKAIDNGKRIEIPPALSAAAAANVVIFDIVGISPLLMNNPISMSRPDAGIGVKKIPAPEVEAAGKIYKLADGQLCVPSIQFRSSLLKATSGRRIGKMSAGAIIAGSVFTVETECPLVNAKTGAPIKDWKIHTTRAVIQGVGVLRSRPQIDDWATSVAFEIDPQFTNAGLVEELLNIAGKIKGIGDWRPERKGSFGRFVAKMRQN